MTSTVWVVLGLAVVVLIVVVAGVVAGAARRRRRRAGDLASTAGLVRTLAGATGEGIAADDLPGAVARAIDPLSLDAYLEDAATRERVDTLLDLVALQRNHGPEGEPQPGQDSGRGLARRRLDLLRERAERYRRFRPRPDGDDPAERG